jgi:deoxyhypusine synthase
MALIYDALLELWQKTIGKGERYFPHEYFYQLIREGVFKEHYQIDAADSWLVAAAEKNLPLYVPGWEDSTSANQCVASVKQGRLPSCVHIKTGLDYMGHLIDWYKENSRDHKMGFFQIGGGIAGDFPICVVPLIRQDMHDKVPLWAYFCQISDSTTSYGSYSGAVPNEKITWEKIAVDTPRFVIESDASIVAPLIFKYVLEKGHL